MQPSNEPGLERPENQEDNSVMSIAEDIFTLLTGCRLPSRADQARRWAVEAMEELCGAEAVALALAPAPEEPAAQEIDRWAAEVEAREEGRHADPFGRGRVNMHE